MPEATTRTLSLSLSAAPQSAAKARNALNRLDLDPDTHADVALLISELVSAAILDQVENGPTVAVTVACSREGVRVDVTAPAAGLARLAERDGETHGFTVRLLDDLASSWGGSGDGAATTVFFEVSTREDQG